MKVLIWCRLLNKRFLKKPAFLAMLALIPALAVVLTLLAGDGGGLLTVALCPAGGVSEEVAGILMEEDGVLRCVLAESEEEARALVADGGADAAWIFSDRGDEVIRRYAAGGSVRAPFVTVVEREDNTFLRLALEKLYAALFPSVSRATWEAFLERESGTDELPEEALSKYEHWIETEEAPIRFSYMDGTEAEVGEDYLRSPTRGLLAILMILGGVAAAMIYLRDRRAGALVWVGGGASFPLSAAYLLLPMLDMAVMTYLALYLAGLSVGWGYEALLLFLLVFSGAGLAMLIARLCGSEARIGVAALVLTVCMLALCPVFLNVRALRGLSLLLPPYYYLHAVHNREFALYLAAYAVIVWLLDFGLFLLQKRKGAG